MIGMQNKNSQLKTKGFVLAEAIFSLFVTMLVLFILQNLLLSVKKANLSENQHMNEVAYAYVQLDRYMHDEDTKMVYPLVNEGKAKSATFVKVNKDKSAVERPWKRKFLGFTLNLMFGKAYSRLNIICQNAF